MFSLPPPVLLQLVHSLKTRHHPSLPPSLLPSGSTIGSPFALLDQSPCHGLCLSSVHNICSRSLYAPLGNKLSSPDGALLLKKGSKASASSTHTATGTECWNPIIHLISICSVWPSVQSLCLPSHLWYFRFLSENTEDALNSDCKTEVHKKRLCDFGATTFAPTQSSMASDMKARSKNINLIVLRLDSWPQAGGRDSDREG